jgi:hypothetical protein
VTVWNQQKPAVLVSIDNVLLVAARYNFETNTQTFCMGSGITTIYGDANGSWATYSLGSPRDIPLVFIDQHQGKGYLSCDNYSANFGTPVGGSNRFGWRDSGSIVDVEMNAETAERLYNVTRGTGALGLTGKIVCALYNMDGTRKNGCALLSFDASAFADGKYHEFRWSLRDGFSEVK